MLLFILGLLAGPVLGDPGCLLDASNGNELSCDYKGYSDPTKKTADSMQWLDMFIDDWLQTNKDKLTAKLSEELNSSLQEVIPPWMVKLDLQRFGFEPGFGPIFSQVLSSHDVVECQEGCSSSVTLRRLKYDLHIGFLSKKSIADLSIELPLGVTGMLSLKNTALYAHARLEVLMDTRSAVPGLVSATFSFIEKPKFRFEISLYNWIGLDKFGVDTWVGDNLKALIQKKLVHPGTLFIDLRGLSSGAPISSKLVPAHPDAVSEYPVAYSVGLRVYHTKGTEKQEFAMKIWNNGKELVDEPHFVNECNWYFDFALPSLEEPVIEVELYQVLKLAVDPIIRTVSRDLSQQIYTSENANETTSFNFIDGVDHWRFEVTTFAKLLPAVMIEQKGKAVTQYPSLYTTAPCNSKDCPGQGIVYVHLHRVGDLKLASSTTMDPYVRVYLANSTQVFRSEVGDSGEAIFDEAYQMMLLTLDKHTPISHQSLKFEVWDRNKFTSDKMVGSHTLKGLPSLPLVNEEMPLEGDGSGFVYASVAFKPVPFY